MVLVAADFARHDLDPFAECILDFDANGDAMAEPAGYDWASGAGVDLVVIFVVRSGGVFAVCQGLGACPRDHGGGEGAEGAAGGNARGDCHKVAKFYPAEAAIFGGVGERRLRRFLAQDRRAGEGISKGVSERGV